MSFLFVFFAKCTSFPNVNQAAFTDIAVNSSLIVKWKKNYSYQSVSSTAAWATAIWLLLSTLYRACVCNVYVRPIKGATIVFFSPWDYL